MMMGYEKMGFALCPEGIFVIDWISESCQLNFMPLRNISEGENTIS
jgi:hypothetical protein